VQASHTLLSSTDATANRDLAMILMQIATVSRGDEVRSKKANQMDARKIDAAGEQSFH
jgi:hypothetical protein